MIRIITFCSIALILFTASIVQAETTDDLVFIHHSCGFNWLNDGLNAALVAKDYIDERNDIYYSVDVTNDEDRPNSISGNAGDSTDMQHWILWFNDYLEHIKAHDAANGENKIIMFKSCYPNSGITEDGSEPGDPFLSTRSLVNYKAIFRHQSGTGNTYSNEGYTYKPLEDIFAENPDTLFIYVTSPPLCKTCTNSADAARARTFNNWVKTDWLDSYNTANSDLSNVIVYDWFDFLANASDALENANMLKDSYYDGGGDSHPNNTANTESTTDFSDSFIDTIWASFSEAQKEETPEDDDDDDDDETPTEEPTDSGENDTTNDTETSTPTETSTSASSGCTLIRQ